MLFIATLCISASLATLTPLNHSLVPMVLEQKPPVNPDDLFYAMTKPYGYPSAAYSTITEDGYILKLFRIQAKNTQFTAGKKVAFLQHGLLDSADDWVINDENKALGKFLANAGYDVWLGNSRGNKYSRANKFMSPETKQFWNFSFQEMARDVVANIDFILNFTNQPKLYYFGHSQGTSQMFAGLSDAPTSDFINQRVYKFFALAPVVYLANQTSTMLKAISAVPLLEQTMSLFGIDEILPGALNQSSIQSKAQVALCTAISCFCHGLIGISDYKPTYDNEEMMPLIAAHSPSGTSLRTLVHFKQMTNQDKRNPVFKKFDFGERGNLENYGQKTPPVFNLNLIKIPVRSFIGLDDKLGDPLDNQYLTAELQRLGKNHRAYTYGNVGHMTFMWAINPANIFNDILRELNTFD
jgi:pimeloyl-ACP methyl ester carboxylesterase